MSDRPDTPLLDRVHIPADLKQFSDAELEQIARELRLETVSAVSETGGHLGAGLGVVELTLHYTRCSMPPRTRSSGTCRISVIRTRSSPAGGTAFAPFG